MASLQVRRQAVCVVFAMLVSAGSQLSAQERADPFTVAPADAQSAAVLVAPAPMASAKRPAALIPLYVSFAGLQALDIHSTRQALAAGGSEGNPLLRHAVGSTMTMVAIKAGVGTGIIVLTEKLRKRNRVAAVALMATLNSAFAVVAAHNYSLAR